MLNEDNKWDFDSMFILDGVLNGFRVVDPDAEIPLYDCKNYNSCFSENNYEKMNQIMHSELSAGKISIANTKPLQIHALGAIPKPNGSVRHITDCSRPVGKSVNKFMSSTFSKFSYNTIDDAITHVTTGSYMATVDLQDAYRSVPIYPKDRQHFGLEWDFGDGPTFLTDNFLCFGSKCSAFIFNRLTDAVSRFMTIRGHCCFNYLDDFIIIAESLDECCTAQNLLIATLRSLGFYISWKKVEGPSQYCRYLGIDIDAVNQRLLLPAEKIHKLDTELTFWKNKQTSTKIQMQRLCGTLNFCCKVVRGGRIFMFHMIQLLKHFNHNRRIELPPEFHKDLQWWISFSETFNGYADFFDPVVNTVEMYTDACLYGLAAICENDFYQARVLPCADNDLHCVATSDHAYEIFVPIEHAANINVLEMIAVLIGVYRWNNEILNKRLIIHCDNLQVCYNLGREKTKNELTNVCLRNIFWKCVECNAYISPSYIPSTMNIDADYLSRAVYF